MKAQQQVRLLIWVYFYLWMFEGALRFWVFPSLSDPLLIVRDPVVIVIYLVAGASGLMPKNWIVFSSYVLSFFAFIFALTLGHGTLTVALYGLRATFLHIPLIFVIMRVWRQEDLNKLGKVLLWLSVPMAFLVVYQFSNPAEHWINKGGMRAHYSTVRPAGTFSFVSGMVAYSSLLASFMAHSFSSIRHFGLVRSFSATIALLSMVAVSNSRTVVFSVSAIFVMMFGLALFKGSKAIGPILLLGILGLAFSSISSVEFVEEGTKSLKRRFVDAQGDMGIVEGAFSRVTMDPRMAFAVSSDTPIFGLGIGLGTNAGARLISGQRRFLAGETEFVRQILELGPILGWWFMMARAVLVWQMFRSSMRAYRMGNLLPLLLFSSAAIPVFMGQWGVPTNQGFASLAAGFCLASAKLTVRRRRPVNRAPVLMEEHEVTELAPVNSANPGLS